MACTRLASILALTLASGTALAQGDHFSYEYQDDLFLNAAAEFPVVAGGTGGWASVGRVDASNPAQLRMPVVRHAPSGALVWDRVWRVNIAGSLEDIVGTDVVTTSSQDILVAGQTTWNPATAFDYGNILARFNGAGNLLWSWNYLGQGFISEPGPALTLGGDGVVTMVGTALRPGGAPGNRGHLVRASGATGAPILQRIVSASIGGVGVPVQFTDVVEYPGGRLFIVGYTVRGGQSDIIVLLGNLDLSLAIAYVVDIPMSDERDVSVDIRGDEVIVAAPSRTMASSEPDSTIVLRMNPSIPPTAGALRWGVRLPQFIVGARGTAFDQVAAGGPETVLLAGREFPLGAGRAAVVALDGLGAPQWGRRYGAPNPRESFDGIATSPSTLFAVGQRIDGATPISGYGVTAPKTTGVTDCLDDRLPVPVVPLEAPLPELGLNVEAFSGALTLPLAFVRGVEAVDLCTPPCDPDVNCDGNVDQDDIDCLAQAVAGDLTCICVDPDFNRDGNVDQDDIDALAQVIAGQPCP
ncbi:MAG: hypothetical protein SFY69_06705 [Planctomycetota bacterium]|nr:hypothetical protein [Planctomycetota bacterium]